MCLPISNFANETTELPCDVTINAVQYFVLEFCFVL